MLGQRCGLLKQQDTVHLWPHPLTLYQQSVVHVKLHKPRYPLASAGNVAPCTLEGGGITLVCNYKTFYPLDVRKCLFNLYLKTFHISHLTFYITACKTGM